MRFADDKRGGGAYLSPLPTRTGVPGRRWPITSAEADSKQEGDVTQSMRRIAAVGVVSCAAAAGCSAGSGDLPRFHQVNKNIYRGAQPTDAGLAQLKERGVKTVLNLRVDDSLHDREAERVNTLGMKYVSVPVSRFLRPSEDEVERSLA